MKRLLMSIVLSAGVTGLTCAPSEAVASPDSAPPTKKAPGGKAGMKGKGKKAPGGKGVPKAKKGKGKAEEQDASDE
jgi:hypothetical protein